MVGRNIRFIIVFIFLLHSCQKKEKEIKLITYEYIDYFSSLKNKQRNFMLKVNVDSTNVDFKVFRVSMFPFFLEQDEVPNIIDVYEGFKISYFTKKIKKDLKIINMKKKLEQKGFYNFDSLFFDSNYPEWVILNNKKSGKQFVVKDMWYQPIDSIIKKYKKEIE